MFKRQGQFYPQGGSKCIEVEVHLHEAGELRLVNESENLDILQDLKDCHINPKLGDIPRELSLPNAGLLSIAACTELDVWLAGSSGASIDKLERSSWLILTSVLLVPLLLYGLFKYAIPYAAIIFADAVPDAAVSVASQQTLKTLERTVLDPSKIDQAEQQALMDYWQTVLAQMPSTDKQFNILFRDSSRLGANAFALPDGTIVFTDQLVELFESDRALLTSVLLHEIGHVEYQHSMRLIAETLVATVALSYFFGDVSSLLEFFGGVSNTILQNQFTQDLEWEADNFALSHLEQVGLSNQAFADAMTKLAEKIGEQSQMDSILQSHPLMQERIQNALEANQKKR
ncbi:M48 family metallopeptidase [Glaciecola sp. SC05]|uniref:M48 family metallopeptidase n=1 Tax=Glaciecola sp. SC05 TaxID=1987355 RepID=UPI003529A49D